MLSSGPPPLRFVFATRNPHKLAELGRFLEGSGLELVGLDAFPDAPVVEETGDTFEANARLKAEALRDATGLPALADDSGLCVPVLDGAPGVFSARFAGKDASDDDNNRFLLERLHGAADRRAEFVCVLAWAVPGQPTRFFRGETRGILLTAPRAAHGGFGYDPLFLSEHLGLTFAEADPAQKNAVSHRGRALAAWRNALSKETPSASSGVGRKGASTLPRPRIAILDARAVNPGDLSWDALEKYGDVVAYADTPPEAIVPRLEHADAVLINKIRIDAALLDAEPNVRYVGLQSTGYNVVDLDAARARNVAVTNVPGYSTMSVAQHVFALLLELANRTGAHAADARDGTWSRAPLFTAYRPGLVELDGRLLGVVGYGTIGRAVARIGAAFGMQVAAYTRHPPGRVVDGVAFMGLDELLFNADVVSLHAPLTPQTRGLLDRDHRAMMKPTAFLINTARGELVDETALAEALREGRLAGAGLDVLSTEPPPADHPLLSAPNAVVTPHMAWATTEARGRLIHEVAENLRAFLHGEKRNRLV